MAHTRLILSLIFLIPLAPPVARAVGGPGSAFGEGLRLTNTAWALGMSEAMAASAEGVSALSLNPAGILDGTLTTLHITHTFFVEDLAEDYFAYSQRLPFGSAIGMSVHGLYDSSTARTLEDAQGNFAGEAGAFPVGFAVGGAAYALDLAPFLGRLDFLQPTGGASLRVVWQQVDNRSWLGMTMDFGFKLRPGSGFILGGVLQNAGLVKGQSRLPLQWVTGVAWRGQRLLSQTDRLLVEVDSPVAVDRDLAFRVGSEYQVRFNKVGVAIRGGWKQEVEVPEAIGISTGVGFRWFLGRTPWGVDYAFVPWGIFGNLHAISLTVGLIPAPTEKVISKPKRREWPIVFYPLKGEQARYEVIVGEPAELSVALLDEGGIFVMTLYERRVVWKGTVEVIWDGRLLTGMWANFEMTYRIRVQLGDQTWYKDVIPKKESILGE